MPKFKEIRLVGMFDEHRPKIEALMEKKAEWYETLESRMPDATPMEKSKLVKQMQAIEWELVLLDRILDTVNTIEGYYAEQLKYLADSFEAQTARIEADAKLWHDLFKQSCESEQEFLNMLIEP
jgi:hypothetical protein